MKRLLLIRHAKATNETGFADFERPLQPSGLQDAAKMAGRIKQKELIPELLVASPALRTMSTANVFSQHLDLAVANENSDIYDASEEQLIEIICQLNDVNNFVGLIGHNPGIAQVLYYFSGEIRDVLPCAVVLLEFDVEAWAAISAKSGRLVYYDTPDACV